MVIWLVCVLGSAALFTGIGIYSIHRKEPMWFWAGTEGKIKAGSLTDVKAYNRANGVMWIVYSLLFWAAGILGVWRPVDGGILLGVSGTFGMAALVYAYKKIFEKYSK